MKKLGWILYKLICALGLAYSTYRWTHYFAFYWRGYEANGGEVLLALFVGIGVFIGLDKFIDLVLESVEKLNRWIIKRREPKTKHERKSKICRNRIESDDEISNY